ncbi:unnamed protein product, partial [Chrysoparadoxa australica]
MEEETSWTSVFGYTQKPAEEGPVTNGGADSSTTVIVKELNEELVMVKLGLAEAKAELGQANTELETLRNQMSSASEAQGVAIKAAEEKGAAEWKLSQEQVHDLQTSNNKLLWSNRELQDKLEALQQGDEYAMFSDQMKEADAMIVALREEKLAGEARLKQVMLALGLSGAVEDVTPEELQAAVAKSSVSHDLKEQNEELATSVAELEGENVRLGQKLEAAWDSLGEGDGEDLGRSIRVMKSRAEAVQKPIDQALRELNLPSVTALTDHLKEVECEVEALKRREKELLDAGQLQDAAFEALQTELGEAFIKLEEEKGASLELASAASELAQKEELLRALHLEVASLTADKEDVDAYANKLQQAQEVHGELEAQLAAAHHAATLKDTAAEQHIAALQEELEAVRSKADGLELQVSQLEGSHASHVEGLHDEMRGSKARHSAQLEETQAYWQELVQQQQGQVQQLESERQELLQDREEAETSLNQQLANLQAVNQGLQQEQAAHHARLEELESEREAIVEEHEQGRARVHELETEQDSLIWQHEQDQTRAAELEAAAEALRQQQDHDHARLNQLTQQIDNMEEERRSLLQLQEQSRDTAATVESLEEQLRQGEARIDGVERDKEGLMMLLEESEEQLQRLKQEKAEEAFTLRDQLDALMNEAHSLKEQNGELETRAAALTGEKQSLTAELAESREKVQWLEEASGQMNDGTVRENDALKRTVESLKTQVEALHIQIEIQSKELEDELVEHMLETDALKAQLAQGGGEGAGQQGHHELAFENEELQAAREEIERLRQQTEGLRELAVERSRQAEEAANVMAQIAHTLEAPVTSVLEAVVGLDSELAIARSTRQQLSELLGCQPDAHHLNERVLSLLHEASAKQDADTESSAALDAMLSLQRELQAKEEALVESDATLSAAAAALGVAPGAVPDAASRAVAAHQRVVLSVAGLLGCAADEAAIEEKLVEKGREEEQPEGLKQVAEEEEEAWGWEDDAPVAEVAGASSSALASVAALLACQENEEEVSEAVTRLQSEVADLHDIVEQGKQLLRNTYDEGGLSLTVEGGAGDSCLLEGLEHLSKRWRLSEMERKALEAAAGHHSGLAEEKASEVLEEAAVELGCDRSSVLFKVHELKKLNVNLNSLKDELSAQVVQLQESEASNQNEISKLFPADEVAALKEEAARHQSQASQLQEKVRELQAAREEEAERYRREHSKQVSDWSFLLLFSTHILPPSASLSAILQAARISSMRDVLHTNDISMEYPPNGLADIAQILGCAEGDAIQATSAAVEELNATRGHISVVMHHLEVVVKNYTDNLGALAVAVDANAACHEALGDAQHIFCHAGGQSDLEEAVSLMDDVTSSVLEQTEELKLLLGRAGLEGHEPLLPESLVQDYEERYQNAMKEMTKKFWAMHRWGIWYLKVASNSHRREEPEAADTSMDKSSLGMGNWDDEETLASAAMSADEEPGWGEFMGMLNAVKHEVTEVESIADQSIQLDDTREKDRDRERDRDRNASSQQQVDALASQVQELQGKLSEAVCEAGRSAAEVEALEGKLKLLAATGPPEPQPMREYEESRGSEARAEVEAVAVAEDRADALGKKEALVAAQFYKRCCTDLMIYLGYFL